MTKDEALDLALEALQFKNILNACGQYFVVYPAKAAEAITAIKQARALDKKAENARALGLDYEPVGWWDAKIGFFEEKHFDQLQPLYTAPPAAQRQWVGLTDEDIEKEFGFIDELLRDCVHRTEAKLKEKNGGVV